MEIIFVGKWKVEMEINSKWNSTVQDNSHSHD